MRNTAAAIILFGILAACTSAKPSYCPSPVYASQEAKEWLQSYEPFPPYVREYFKAIGDEQEAIKKNCQ